MRNTGCRIILCLLLAGVILPGCRKEYVFPYPLRLTADRVELNMYEGESRIVVYSDREWTAKLVDEKPWAELVGTGGTGIGDVLFRFTENTSIPRKAEVALAAGAERDTVVFVQNGAITAPSFNFKESILTIAGEAGGYTTPFETDVPDINDLVKASVVYYYEGEALQEIDIYDDHTGLPVEKWITGFSCEPGTMSLNVTANNDGQRRSADLFLLLDNGLGISYRISIRIRQSAL